MGTTTRAIVSMAAAVAITVFVACKKEKPEPEPTGYPSVGTYFQPLTGEAVKVTYEPTGESSIPVFTTQINTEKKDCYNVWHFRIFGSNKPTPGFEEIAKEYNDIDYRSASPEFKSCFRSKVNRIDIIAADDFSSDYPAGSSLNAFCQMLYTDLEYLIDTGYSYNSNFRKYGSLDAFNARAASVGGILFPLDDMFLIFQNLPSDIQPDQHNYTLRYSFADGTLVKAIVNNN